MNWYNPGKFYDNTIKDVLTIKNFHKVKYLTILLQGLLLFNIN